MTSLRLLRETRKLDRIAGAAKGKKPVQPIKNWNIREGDTVQLLSGKDKGKHGVVKAIDYEVNELYVTGLNTRLVENRSDQFKVFHGHIEQEQPLHYSNVALVDPEDGKPCRIKYAYTADGKRVRVSRRSNRIIPFPVKEKKHYFELVKPEGPSNTESKFASKQTFLPSLVTFEDEISALHGLKKLPEATSQPDTSAMVAKPAADTSKKPFWKRIFKS